MIRYYTKERAAICPSTGLPHTQGNSGNFFLNSGRLRACLFFYKNFREVLRFFEKSQGNFFLDLE